MRGPIPRTRSSSSSPQNGARPRSATMFQVLADEGINIQMISTSEIKISVVIEEPDAERAVRALHAAFVEEGAGEPTTEA